MHLKIDYINLGVNLGRYLVRTCLKKTKLTVNVPPFANPKCYTTTLNRLHLYHDYFSSIRSIPDGVIPFIAT